MAHGELAWLFHEPHTQWCIFLSQEVRENRGHFVPLTACLLPHCPRDFHVQNSNYYSKIYTTEYGADYKSENELHSSRLSRWDMSWCPGEPAIPGKHLELSTQVMFPTHGGDLYWERSSDLAPKPHRDMRLTCWRWMRKCGPYSRLRQVDPNFIRECAFLNSTTRIVLLLLGEWGVRTKIRPCSLPKLCVLIQNNGGRPRSCIQRSGVMVLRRGNVV